MSQWHSDHWLLSQSKVYPLFRPIENNSSQHVRWSERIRCRSVALNPYKVKLYILVGKETTTTIIIARCVITLVTLSTCSEFVTASKTRSSLRNQLEHSFALPRNLTVEMWPKFLAAVRVSGVFSKPPRFLHETPFLAVQPSW